MLPKKVPETRLLMSAFSIHDFITLKL